MGRRAAWAEVHPAGRSLLERRFHTAPEPARHRRPPATGSAANSSYRRHRSRSNTITWRSPVERRPPSTGALLGNGYGPRSDSSAQSKATGTRRRGLATVTEGVPVRAPPPLAAPESGWTDGP